MYITEYFLISVEKALFRKKLLICIAALFCTCIWAKSSWAQQAHIYVNQQIIKTYPFGDPDPVPFKKEIYPYFRFDGYSFKGKSRKWKVIYLENPFIKVSVLPGVGGKVWGAIEKSTGNEFIYHNHVLKFRDLGLRGPWTSGGIEFNFGVFGHTPTTATPVDYLIRKNDDGSVSCFIGAIDLASRTHWVVEIRLAKDAAEIQTTAFWYNATPLNTSYYYWANSAVHADSSMQYFFPGTHYITHDGVVHLWPVTKNGRNISYYRNNDFGGSHSYHVLDTYANYYGVYWHNRDFGFGHWARYNKIPGKKIWIWSLSESGQIWKDLLTDSDGQYTEVQAGRLYTQAKLVSGLASPFNQKLFGPGTADRWTEYWFPVKGIGGISDASAYGVMNVSQSSGKLMVGVNALKSIHKTLKVFIDNKLISKKMVKLQPMGVFKRKIEIPSNLNNYTVKLGRQLSVSTKPRAKNKLDRPLQSNQRYDSTTASGLFQIGEEQFAHRHYNKALQYFLKSLNLNGNSRKVLTRIAEVYTRKAMYKKALVYARRALANDTYFPYANFVYGVIKRRTNHLNEANIAFGWAARSLKYRSPAWEQMAEINVHQRRWKDAIYYAQKALNFNSLNVNAYKDLAISYRKEGKTKKAKKEIAKMLKINPLCHVAYFEKYLLKPTDKNLNSFSSLIRNGLPYETYLEVAMDYYNMGLNRDAVKVLKKSPLYPIVNYWLAYLNKGNKRKSYKYLHKALTASPKLVFPFRHETISVLKWALKKKDSWKTKYYLGLIMWSKGRNDEALTLLNECGNEPNYAPFYLTRRKIRGDKNPTESLQDLRHALKINKDQWRTYHALALWYLSHHKIEKAREISEKAYNKFPKNYYLGVQHANILLKEGHYKQSFNVLNNLNVLPSEGAKRAHNIFEQALVKLAMRNMLQGKFKKALRHLKTSRTYPEHLGRGKPYHPDYRIQDYLTSVIYKQQSKPELGDSLYRKIYAYSKYIGNRNEREFNFANLVTLLVYEHYGKEQLAKNMRERFIQDMEQQPILIAWLKAQQSGHKERMKILQKKILTQKAQKFPTWFRKLLRLIYVGE